MKHRAHVCSKPSTAVCVCACTQKVAAASFTSSPAHLASHRQLPTSPPPPAAPPSFHGSSSTSAGRRVRRGMWIELRCRRRASERANARSWRRVRSPSSKYTRLEHEGRRRTKTDRRKCSTHCGPQKQRGMSRCLCDRPAWTT